ncbi:MAG TPA: hypothetical protein VIF62_27735 [Labilithrix sp.]
MRKRAILPGLLVAIVLVTSDAAADTRNVLVIGGGTSFRDALNVALASWDVRVVPLDAAPPSSSMPRAQRDAKAIVERFGASGLVWISNADDEHALWVYDVEKDQLVSRSLGATLPLDAPNAAAAALSVKTLLRSSTVAPATERIGAETRPAEVVTPPATPPDEAPRVVPATPPALHLEFGGGLRAIAGDVDTRFDVGASYWFGEARRWGVGLVGHGGPGLTVDADRFRGRFDELGVSPSLRFRIPVAGRFSLEAKAGTTLHSTRIDGVAVETAKTAKESRLDASIDVGVALDFALGRATWLGLAFDGSNMLRWQRYLVDDDSVLELHPLQGSVGLRLATALP